jgi:hypothetical protein
MVVELSLQILSTGETRNPLLGSRLSQVLAMMLGAGRSPAMVACVLSRKLLRHIFQWPRDFVSGSRAKVLFLSSVKPNNPGKWATWTLRAGQGRGKGCGGHERHYL